MKRTILAALSIAVVLSLAVSADAVPRLQTYAVGSVYKNDYMGWEDTWLTRQSSFDLKVVGAWSGSTRRLRTMDTWLAVGVLRGQSGSLSVNGVELSSFRSSNPYGSSSWFTNSPMGQMEVRYYHVGSLTNRYKRAYDYRRNGPRGPYWGEEISLNIQISGFSYVHFDAVGREGNQIYRNWGSRDATFHRRRGGGGGGHAAPEPGTLTLLGTGLLGMIPVLRRKRKKRQ